MNVLVVLQNAWSPLYAGGEWPHESWLRALFKSRSGQKLRILTEWCPDVEFKFNNSTPIVGNSSKSIIKPDPEHLKKIINGHDALIACGRQAEKALIDIWRDDIICIPHPACKVVTNDVYRITANIINSGEIGRCKLFQRRGYVEQIALD